MSKALGDAGELFVVELLRARGYAVAHIGGNYPVIDLEVDATRPFRVSVKTSQSKRHVRMGTEASISQLRDDDFLFALLPTSKTSVLRLAPGGYDLFIIPGLTARTDALHVHHTYLAEPGRSGSARSASAGVMVKEYSSRLPQREAWGRWVQFRESWSLLPASNLAAATS